MFKKLFSVFSAIVVSLFFTTSVSAYLIQPGDTLFRLAEKFGFSVEELAVSNGIQNPDRIYAGSQLYIPEVFGAASPLPTDGYDSYLSAPLNSSAATIYVNALPGGVTSSIYTLFSSDGRTVAEKVSCTGKSAGPNRLTGCVRGLSLTPNEDGSISEVAGTGVSHSKNARIAITDTINFSGKALAILNGSQPTGTTTFSVGETSTNTLQLFLDSNGKYLRAYNNGTNTPYLRYNTSTNKWQFSDDGVNTINLATSSAAGLAASSTRAIGITDSFIYLLASSTKGLGFDEAGILYPITSSTGGIQFGSDGTSIDRSDALTWTGTQTFSIVSSSVLFVGTTSTLATTTINGIDIDSNAIRKLYIRTGDVTVTGTAETTFASTTVPANMLKGNNAIRIRSYFQDMDGVGTHSFFINLKYGSTTSTLNVITNAVLNNKGWYEAVLSGNGATNAQDTIQNILVGPDGLTTTTWKYSNVGSMAEDSTSAKTLELTVRATNAGNVWSVGQTIIEFIYDPRST